MITQIFGDPWAMSRWLYS